VNSIIELYKKVEHLVHEGFKFGLVGLAGFVVQLTVFNLLRFNGPSGEGRLYQKPLTATGIAMVMAAIVTYLGNRYWTYRHRERNNPGAEFLIFLMLNAVGLGITETCLWISHYALQLTSPLADNIAANVIGLGLGTMFRFWSYRRFVFLAAAQG
jgi:putative flippase GtrA